MVTEKSKPSDRLSTLNWALLPKLKVLTITELAQDYWDMFIDFISHRASGTSSLKEVRMGCDLYESIDPTMLVSLAQYVSITVSGL